MKKSIRGLFALSGYVSCVLLLCGAQVLMARPQQSTDGVQFCTVRAHIVGSDGPPLANVTVYLYRKDHPGDGHTSITDKNGDVSFRSINSRYEYAVDAQIGGYAKAVSGYMKSISGADFAFTLTLPKADSFASGTVVDRFGRPMCGVDVRPQFVSNVHTTTDSNGHFRLVGVPQGDVYIVLTVSAGKIGHDWAFGGRNDSILHCRTLEDWKASLAAHNAAIATDPNLHGDGEDANVLFDNAEKSAAAKGKDVLLVFGSSWCGACYQISHFLEDPNVRSVISAHYVVQEFDVFETTHAEWENPHGIDLYKRFSHGINTIPLWVIVDPSGQDLGDSVKDGKNTGFGGGTRMHEYFLSKITSTAPSITDSELKVLQEALYHVSDDELTVPDSQTPGTTSASGAHG